MKLLRPRLLLRIGLSLSWLLGLALAAAPGRAQEFERFAVASQDSMASEVGAAALRDGGNAIDAAVATAFALAVTHPTAGNLGGGGFIVAYQARTRRVVTIDFREVAPAAATERMYLDPDGELLPRHRSGVRAAGVPGTVRGLGLAHEQFGSGQVAWADLVRPAARLAREGFDVSEALASSLNSQLFDSNGAKRRSGGGDDVGRLADFPASVAAYGKANGTLWRAGDRLVQPDLAATLERIAEQGPDEFYTGETARLIVAAMEADGGIITAEDLAGYRPKLRRPVRGTFRGFDIYGMGPPSSGGLVDLIMLNILERFDLKADGRNHPRTLHRVAEAMRRAYYVRATQIADPDFVPVDVERLASKALADELASTITNRATPSARLANFPVADASEGTETTHLSTIDADGNAVALTYTLEMGYGSKAVVAGAGFLLNNEMGDFNLIPGRTDSTGQIGTEANRIAPRKRMLSSQSPTIVLKDGRVRVVTGSPGGRTIPNTVLWVVLNLLEFDLDPAPAVAAPRTHHQWFPDILMLEGPRWSDETRSALEARGHRLGQSRSQGNANTLVIDPAGGRIHAAPDRRYATAGAAGG